MRTGAEEGATKKKFELPGSKAHYAPSLQFTINHMQLGIEPDLQSKTAKCNQVLDISAIRDIESGSEIELDAAELQIASVSVVQDIGKNNKNKERKVDFRTLDDKLLIKLPFQVKEEGRFLAVINYSAKPRQGLYFTAPDKHYPERNIQVWTQGETTESKYWFPCIDHPLVKFSSTIGVVAPSGFTAISNGKLESVKKLPGGKKKLYIWAEPNPHPAYLTSVVVGKFAESKEMVKDRCELYYYVPENKKQDARRSFEHTKEMVKFFEDYLGTKYPYSKYSQVTVEDFVYGGMENSSCTTLTMDTLHDRKAHIDYTSDHLVSHELAHQWFGDLVTCKDWQHIWLNEGFATYCEALYWEASKGRDEFLYYVMQTADDYFEESSSRYTRPIVTKVYKHPDDLFDRHTYEKGGSVLHMLRNYIGDNYFRRGIKTYMQRFANSTAETDDLRKVFELESGISLQRFFDQWIFRAGHPELKIEFSQEPATGKEKSVKIKVEQAQQGDPFEFPLEIKVVSRGKSRMFTLNITEKETAFQVPIEADIDWFSIDPEFKVLKTISLKAPQEMLILQLKKGSTVVERIEAAKALKNRSSEDAIAALKDSVLHDKFWGVAAEAAKALGSMKSDSAHRATMQCLAVSHPKARRAVVKSIGEFKKAESLEVLKKVLNDSSYFVESEAATAIGKTKNRQAISILKKALESSSFQNIVAQGAVNGLKEFAGDGDIAAILIEKSRYGIHHRVREAATFALGKFVTGDKGGENQTVFDNLKELLTDRWFRVRINACRAFADAESQKAIPHLTWVAEHDLDHRVRRVAEECINLIKDSMSKPKEMAQMREELDNVKSKSLEMMQKMDRLERGLR